MRRFHPSAVRRRADGWDSFEEVGFSLLRVVALEIFFRAFFIITTSTITIDQKKPNVNKLF